MPNTIKKPNIRLYKPFVVLAVFYILLSACNTRSEGCLQLNASNFDLDAERPCDDCCTYPFMSLSLTQLWGEENFSNLDTLYDNQDNPYFIQDLKYFLSTWRWRDDAGTLYTVDSVTAECDMDIISFTPDVIAADTRQFIYTLGTMRVAPLTDSMAVYFGLTMDYSCLDPDDDNTPDNVTSSSPLWNPETDMLETVRMILQRDITDSVTFDTVFFTHKLEIRLPYMLEMRNGINEQFELSVNYQQWFKDVNLGDLNSFEASVVANLPGSIFPTE